MTSDFWVEVEDAYTRAASLPEDERVLFLYQTYPARPDIRREVESLLQYKPAADRLSQSTLLSAAINMFADTDDELIGSIVAGKYLVRERLGFGNMGEVYLADHMTLDVPFALKRPSPGSNTDSEFRRRLLEEARRAVVLKHHNIARVHDIVESGNDIFVVMEYIEGETLRARLNTLGRPMTSEEFLPIAIQCASALDAAHQKRIVHLDVKPENIMLTPAGQVKICDFGVARKLSLGNSPNATAVTEPPWTFAGTPAYMAPEVILSYQFDERADQFSMGTVFYEMLTGRSPFAAETIVATTARVVKEVPPPIRETNRDVDPKLERIILRLLAKEPEERYGSAAALVQELEAFQRSKRPMRDIVSSFTDRLWPASRMRGLAALVLLVVLLVTTAAVFRDSLEVWLGMRPLPRQKILAVLPFKVMGDSKGAQFYSDGVAEILTGRLSQLTTSFPDFQVVSAGEIRGRNVDTPEKAHAEFGATLVMAGTFQFSGTDVRVAYSLIDPASKRELRSGSKVIAAGDPFSMQDSISHDVSGLLEIELTSQQRQAFQSFGTSKPEAYFLYTEGIGALRAFQVKENVGTAIDLFLQAINLDPDYAAAHAALGQAYRRRYLEFNEAGWINQAQKACEKAVSLDQQLADGYVCSGLVDRNKGYYERAVEDFTRAINLQPANDDAQYGLGSVLEAMGNFDGAERVYLDTIEARPHYWAGYMWLAALYKNRRHDYSRAIDYYYRGLAESPGNGRVLRTLAGAFIDSGDYEKAISLLRPTVTQQLYWESYYTLGMAYLRARKYADAVTWFETAAGSSKDYRLIGSLGRAYWLLGQSAKANDTFQLGIAQAEQLLQLNPRDADVHALLGRYYAMLGKRPEAESHLSVALNANSKDPHYLLIAAGAYTRLSDRNNALNLMEQALTHGATMVDIHAEPELDVLSSDPRYIALTAVHKN